MKNFKFLSNYFHHNSANKSLLKPFNPTRNVFNVIKALYANATIQRVKVINHFCQVSLELNMFLISRAVREGRVKCVLACY